MFWVPSGAMRLVRLWLALAVAVYLLLPTRNYYWDGVAFAINVEKQLPPRDTLHPNHLIYTAANVWLYHAALLIGLKTRALFLMQFVNSLLGGASVVLIYRALRHREVSMLAGIAGALAFGFAATWWRFATDANAYIPSIFLVLCANDLLETRRNAVLAGVAHSGAVLFHELAFLFLPVALFRLKEPKKALAYGGSSLTPVGVAYVLAYRTVFGRFDASGLLGWVTTHSPDATFSYQPIRDLRLTLLGTLRLFFGGRLDQVKAEPFTIIGSTALAVCIAALALRWNRGGPRRSVAPPKDLLLWLAVYAAFLFFWMPQNTFYRLFCLAPLILIVCCGSWRSGRSSPAATGLQRALLVELSLSDLSAIARAKRRPPAICAGATRPLAAGHAHRISRVPSRSMDHQLLQSAGLLDRAGQAGPRPFRAQPCRCAGARPAALARIDGL